MQKHNGYYIGITALLGSAILTSLSQVFYAKQVQSTHPFLFTGISFFITAALFHLVIQKQGKSKNSWTKAWKSVVKLNLSSILAFMGFYYALKYIEPAIVSSLEMGLGPLFVLLITLSLSIERGVSKNEWIIALGTLIACIVLIVAIVKGQTGIANENGMILGIIASVLCGLGAVLCTIFSKELSISGWSSSMILAHRFYGIIILSFLFTYDLVIKYLSENIVWILFVTFFGVTLPIYLLQKGIQYCEPFIVMMSICFVPVFTFFFQLFDPRIVWSNITLLGVLFLFVLGVASMFVENKQPK